MRRLNQGAMERKIGPDQSGEYGTEGFPGNADAFAEHSGLSFAVDNEVYTIQIANSLERRVEAYRFIYNVYTAKGYGHPHDSGMWFGKHAMLPGAVTLMAMHGAETVGAVTLVPDLDLKLPSDLVYGSRLDEKRAAGCKLTEVMSLGICSRLRGQREILGKLFSAVHLIPRKVFGSRHLVMTVVPRHVRFYIDQLLFDQEGEFGYHQKTGVTCALALLDLEKKAGLAASVRDNTFYRHFYEEDAAEDAARFMAGQIRTISEHEVAFFLSQRPEIWFDASEEERKVLLQSAEYQDRFIESA